MIQPPELYFNATAQSYLKNLDEQLSFSKLFVLTDTNTSTKCLPAFKEQLGHSDFIEITCEAGELHKNIQTCSAIWSALTEHKADRNALLVLLGGGVLTDMGAFAASCYKRGVRFLNIPTTLLAMVDASTGSKTGIDFKGLKNHIGLFSSPIATLVDQQYLKTLDQRNLKSGVAEMFKHGLIYNREHWKALKEYHLKPENLIADSVAIKIDIVNQDPTEKGLRKILNFGHTLGHAIETHFLESSQQLLHGEAIALGMILEAYLSHASGSLTQEELDEITTTLCSYYELPSLTEADRKAIVPLLQHDKKNAANIVQFVGLKKIGEALYDVQYSAEAIDDCFEYYDGITCR
ncbi:MAG: 3-dehydroquinate synthase [Flavobacteriaceae bacterium]